MIFGRLVELPVEMHGDGYGRTLTVRSGALGLLYPFWADPGDAGATYVQVVQTRYRVTMAYADVLALAGEVDAVAGSNLGPV